MTAETYEADSGCRNGHNPCTRYASSGRCVQCAREHYEKNREAYKARSRARYLENSEDLKAYAREKRAVK